MFPKKSLKFVSLSELLIGINDFLAVLGVKDGGIDNDGTDKVWVNVGGWSSVLIVSFFVGFSSDWDSDGRSSVSDSVGEGFHGGGFVGSGQSVLVVFSVDEDVLEVLFLEFGEVVFDNELISSFSSGFFGGVVGVASRSVPVGSDGLGFEFDGDSVFFSQSDEDVSGQDVVISTFDSVGDTNLVLPLSGSDLGIESGKLDSSLKTESKMGLGEISSEGVLVSD